MCCSEAKSGLLMSIGLVRAGFVCMGSSYTVEVGCTTFGDVVGMQKCRMGVLRGVEGARETWEWVYAMLLCS